MNHANIQEAVRIVFEAAQSDLETRIKLAEVDPELRYEIIDDLAAGRLAPDSLIANDAYDTLIRAFGAGMLDRANGVYAFRKALYDNDLASAKRLAAKFNVTAEEATEISEKGRPAWEKGEGELLPDLADLGYSSEVKWLFNHFHLRPQYLIESGALINAAGRGHSGLTKWLFAKTGITALDQLEDGAHFFAATASSDNTELLQWLIRKLNIVPTDEELKEAFGQSADADALKSLAWLEEKYHPSRALVIESDALYHAFLYNHLDVADWLAKTYGLTFTDAFAAVPQGDTIKPFGKWLAGKLDTPIFCPTKQ
jgi:hypothetical protein